MIDTENMTRDEFAEHAMVHYEGLIKALTPFAEHYEAAFKAFNGDPVKIGEVCRNSVSSFDFKDAAGILSKIKGK